MISVFQIPRRAYYQGLSGAPVSRHGVAQDGTIVYLDANGDRVIGDGSLFTGIYTLDLNGNVVHFTNGKFTRLVSGTGVGAAIGGAAGTTTTATLQGRKCCNCQTTDVSENWFLAQSRRTAKDVPVTIVRRKIECTDPNSKVKIDCNKVKGAAGLQGLSGLGCGCSDNRM